MNFHVSFSAYGDIFTGILIVVLFCKMTTVFLSVIYILMFKIQTNVCQIKCIAWKALFSPHSSFISRHNKWCIHKQINLIWIDFSFSLKTGKLIQIVTKVKNFNYSWNPLYRLRLFIWMVGHARWTLMCESKVY